MLPIHTNMAAGRWQEMSFAEQMGNIGSELARARAAEERGDKERRNRSLERAIELADLTLGCEDRERRRLELGQLRDALRAIRAGADAGASLAELEHYCLPFAILARKHL